MTSAETLLQRRPWQAQERRLKMSAIRKAARGEECTLNIAGVCSYDPETVVLCHFRMAGI